MGTMMGSGGGMDGMKHDRSRSGMGGCEGAGCPQSDAHR